MAACSEVLDARSGVPGRGCSPAESQSHGEIGEEVKWD